MRKSLVFTVCFLIFAGTSGATHLYMKKRNGTIVVYTKSAPFFRRAFRLSKPGNRKRIMELIKEKAMEMGVDPHIALSIAKIESDFNQNTVSSSGAVGVMQLMKKTADYYGVKDRNSVEENIKGGLRFIKHLVNKYHDVKLVAAAYNAGETAVDKYGGIPPFRQTVRYVKKFLMAYNGTPERNGRLKAEQKKHTRKIVFHNGTYTNIGGLW